MFSIPPKINPTKHSVRERFVQEDFNWRRTGGGPQNSPVEETGSIGPGRRPTSASNLWHADPRTFSSSNSGSSSRPGGPHGHFNGMKQVKDFIHTLLHYGGYNEMADILVNLTSLATKMGQLVSEGYVLMVLAPNDEAMAKLTTDQLSEPGAPE